MDKMMIFLMLFFLGGLRAASAQVSTVIDQPKDWGSWQEVIVASNAARAAARGASEGQATMVDAVWIGLRSVEYIWTRDVKEQSKLMISEEELLRGIARRHSLREIAIFGFFLTLAETRNLGNENEIKGHFKSDDFSQEVLCRRSEALKYIAILLDDSESKEKEHGAPSGSASSVPTPKASEAPLLLPQTKKGQP